MEDESGLELSLGLSFGGSSSKSKTKDVPSEPKVDDGGSSKLVSGNVSASDVSFKNLFQRNVENQDHSGKQKSDPVSQSHESFWTDLGKRPASAVDGSNDVHGSQSQFTRYQEFWLSSNKATDAEEDKSGMNQRKLSFEEINLQKKPERDAQGKGLIGGPAMKKLHVSLTTEDGSTGENEEVAESEVEGSNPWLVSQREDSSKSSGVAKVNDKQVVNDPSGTGFQGAKQQLVLGNESNSDVAKVAYGIPLSLQPLTVMTVPYPVPVKVPTATSAPNAPGFPSPCVMQLMPLANNEQPAVQSVNTNGLQLAFGYSTVQLPTLETSSWAFGSQPQQMSSLVMKDHADGTPYSQHSQDDARRSNAPVQVPHISSDITKGSGKHVAEAGASSSSQAEDEGKGSNSIFKQKETAQPAVESFSYEGSSIRPGIAPNLKFGGCGSYPDLPWVSTTGAGPNGKTISGVTYKYDKNQIKIVCACHGHHMSPEEFIQHASADASNPENTTSLASFPTSNPAASAQN